MADQPCEPDQESRAMTSHHPQQSSTEWLVFPDEETLRAEALRRIVSVARQAQEQRGHFAMALSGGSTPRKLYESWAHLPEFNWQHTELFWGDERALPPTDLRSNYYMVKAALLDHVPIPPQHVHRMPAELADLDAAAYHYEATLRQNLGRDGRLDLALLGLGVDAHTASLFPGEQAIAETRRWVVGTPAPSIASRLTGTSRLFNAARHVIFLVSGENKRQAIARVRTPGSDCREVPAAAIQPTPGTLTWLLDQPAAGNLASSIP